MTYTDDQLRAYLDGSFEDAAGVEAAVEHDADLADRLAKLDPFAAPIRDAFHQLEVPNPKPLTVSKLPKWGALAACAAIFAVLGWFAKPTPSEGWMAEVAAYQALYVPATVDIAVSPADQQAQLDRVSAALGRDLAPLADVEDGVIFKRAQVLGFEGAPIAQLVFQDSVGGPIALCLIQSDQGSKPAAFDAMRGMAAASWATATHEVLLIGGTNPELIQRLSGQFQEILG